MTLELKPETAEGLQALASAQGLSVEDYLQQLVERELPAPMDESESSDESGMVWENGLFIYRGGTPLPAGYVDNAIRRLRDERAQHILGNRP
jgi:hypothetical protein